MPTPSTLPPLPTTEPERTILEVLAVAYDPVTVSELALVLTALGSRRSRFTATSQLFASRPMPQPTESRSSGEPGSASQVVIAAPTNSVAPSTDNRREDWTTACHGPLDGQPWISTISILRPGKSSSACPEAASIGSARTSTLGHPSDQSSGGSRSSPSCLSAGMRPSSESGFIHVFSDSRSTVRHSGKRATAETSWMEARNATRNPRANTRHGQFTPGIGPDHVSMWAASSSRTRR